MNKTYMYVIGAIIIAALIWYGTQASSPTSTNQESSTETTTIKSDETSLRKLLAAGTPQQCTYSDDGATGTTYIANNQVRADFTTKVEGTTEMGHMLLISEKLYIWTDGETQGFMVDAKEDKDTSASGAAENQLNLDNNLEYDCQAWRVDASKFQKPANVTFSDMNSFTSGANGGFDFSGLGR